MTSTTPALPPVIREVEVAAPLATCFKVFVDGFDTWWPTEHHLGEDRDVVEFRIEPEVGGRCYDVDRDGGVSHWGTVLAIDPPTRLAFAWHIQGDWTCDTDPARQSEVEVTFTEVGPDRTRVRLEHRNLERHAGADGLRQGVSGEGGWTLLLGRFSDVIEGRTPRPVPTPAG
jgi:uncharacterized protein YndB with AHSA1/START domain